MSLFEVTIYGYPLYEIAILPGNILLRLMLMVFGCGMYCVGPFWGVIFQGVLSLVIWSWLVRGIWRFVTQKIFGMEPTQPHQ